MGETGNRAFDEQDKKLIRLLQEELPLCERPYAELAAQCGLSEREVLDRVERWVGDGTIRRFGAVLYHQRVGFRSNCMVVWRVEDSARWQEVGETLAGFQWVSHCYRRPGFEGWPYTHYTMVHASSPEQLDERIAEMSRATGIGDYRMLHSVREWKKTSMKYFCEKES